MHITNEEIHIWTASLAQPQLEQSCSLMLSPDEQERAARFRFNEHKRRFVIARATLRQILSFYLQITPGKIIFNYGEHGKPGLKPHSLQFNLTHSDDLAVYAIALQMVGIDIEKIKQKYEAGLPERFFSTKECEELKKVAETDRVKAFYQIWARKEAIIKASGKGLATSLANFSVSGQNIYEEVALGEEVWHLHPLSIDPAFASALASQYPVKKLSYYNFTDYLNKI